MKRTIFSLLFIFAATLLMASPKVKSGKLVEYKNFESSIIKPRDVFVWLPDSYNPKERYEVIYMHDGQMLFDSTTTWNKQEWMVDEVATELIESGKTRPFIVVGVANITKDRFGDYFPQKTLNYAPKGVEFSEDYTPNADNYLRFLVEELKPFIDKNYSTKRRAKHTSIMGSSMGGLISLYAVCEYPKVFGSAACLSIHTPMVTSSALEDMNPDIFAEAFREYLKENLPKTNSRKIYMDRGDQTLDATYPKYQDALDKLFEEMGWKSPIWFSMVYPGTAHREIDWAERLHIPFIFLKGEEKF